MRRSVRVLGKLLASILLLWLLAVWVTGVSPVYRFRSPEPFMGPDVFNPYRSLDTTLGWKRANLHTHTRVKGPFPPNECARDAAYTDSVYRELGYDIITFSNHNELTVHPYDPQLQVNVYEQGYSPFKFHKLVFGSRRVRHWDPLLPLLNSQKQFELDRLGSDAELIQLNHPYRTIGTSQAQMEALSGYEIMELDTGVSTENAYWDWALSAGHYSFGMANDDLHDPDRTDRIAVRCNFLNTPSGQWQDLRKTLMDGCYYAMRVPDYGEGDWARKLAGNQDLPSVTGIGLEGQTLYMTLSRQADSIRVNGQGHRTLALVEQADSIRYTLPPEEPYARFTAFFPGGEVIYSNPFARYDASVADTPFNQAPQPVNLPMSILWNLLLLLLSAATLALLVKMWKKSVSLQNKKN